jgi:cytoskeletal protein CcmA (bactofilin family)
VICPTELQCSTYADGELPENEARLVAEHLESCGTCRRLVDALCAEREVLVRCFQDTEFLEFELEDSETAPAATGLGISFWQFAVGLVAIAALIRPVFDFLAAFEWPDNLDWLNPFSSSGQITLLFSTATYVVPQIIASAGSVLNALSFIVFAALMIAMFMMLVRRSVMTGAVLSVIALVTVFSSSSYAFDVRRSNQPVTIPPGETIDDTLVVLGDSVDIDGTVSGDLIALARRVSIRGTVKGSVFSLAQQLEIEGTVEGTVIGGARSIQASGQITRNLYAFGQDVMITSKGHVEGNAATFSAISNIDGAIGRDLVDFSATTSIHGDIAHNVLARAQTVSVLAPAHIGGNLTAHVQRKENLHVDVGSKVDGTTNIEFTTPRPSRYATLSFYIWQCIWLVAAFLTGMVTFWVFPSLARLSLDTSQALLIAAGLGFLGLVVPPIAAIIISITLIGLPLGLIMLAAWIVAGYLAKIVIAVFLGRSMLASREVQAPALALTLLAGLVPIYIAINLPYVGGLISFVLILLGLGGLMKTIYQAPRWRPQAA